MEKIIMKKHYALRIISFIIIFALLCGLFTFVFHKRPEDFIYTRNQQFYKDKEDDFDVLFLGTSEMYADFTPMEIYHETGIKSFNLATSLKSAFEQYYQLRTALKSHKVKVVVCDFSSLDTGTADVDREWLFRKFYMSIPNKYIDIKYHFLKDMHKTFPDEDPFYYVFQLARFHSMWDQMTYTENFMTIKDKDAAYKDYLMGCEARDHEYDTSVISLPSTDIVPDYWSKYTDRTFNLVDTETEYYDKLINLCKENNITVIALYPPNVFRAAEYETCRDMFNEYFQERGVIVADYNNYQAITDMNLNLLDDYYDPEHLNYKGAAIMSKTFGDYLIDNDIVKPNNVNNDKWDKYYKEYAADYGIGD
jgi:hypothetical protein